MQTRNVNISHEKIGQEAQPLITADNFFPNVDDMIEACLNRPFGETKTYYPGLRSAAPNQYIQAIVEMAREVLCDTFKFSIRNLKSIESFYSYVNRPPEKLAPYQRIPHFDRPNKTGIACVHYLFRETLNYGGTSFYRHKNTGFEYVDENRASNYLKSLKKDIQDFGLPFPPSYINGDTKIFTRYFSREAKFNRALFYPACSLHSGDIYRDHDFRANITNSRLTMTTFIQIE